MVHSQALNALRNTERGAVFILGNGPSLLGMEHLDDLRELPTFGCNRLVQWKDLSFTPTYYACNQIRVLEGIEPANPRCEKTKFLLSYRDMPMDGWVLVRKGREKQFGGLGESLPYVRTRGTMVFVMVQIALWLGFERLYLLGAEQRGSGHVFDPEGKVVPFLPVEDSQMQSEWKSLKGYAASAGRLLLDCTPGGRLNPILGYTPLDLAIV